MPIPTFITIITQNINHTDPDHYHDHVDDDHDMDKSCNRWTEGQERSSVPHQSSNLTVNGDLLWWHMNQEKMIQLSSPPVSPTRVERRRGRSSQSRLGDVSLTLGIEGPDPTGQTGFDKRKSPPTKPRRFVDIDVDIHLDIEEADAAAADDASSSCAIRVSGHGADSRWKEGIMIDSKIPPKPPRRSISSAWTEDHKD